MKTNTFSGQVWRKSKLRICAIIKNSKISAIENLQSIKNIFLSITLLKNGVHISTLSFRIWYLANTKKAIKHLAICTISSPTQMFFKRSGIEVLRSSCKNFQEFFETNASFRVRKMKLPLLKSSLKVLAEQYSHYILYRKIKKKFCNLSCVRDQ